MPVYEYRCDDCGKKFDLFAPQRMSLEGVACRHCQSTRTHKLVSVFARVGADEESSWDAGESESAGGCGCGGNCSCASGS